jgi:hypothetical protein
VTAVTCNANIVRVHFPSLSSRSPTTSRAQAAIERARRFHPVYAIDVCRNKALASCKPEDDSKWTPIHEWFRLEEDETE